MPADDSDLVSSAREGDLQAFGELVRRHQHHVYRAVRRIVRDAHVSEDLAQDAFVAAWRGLEAFQGASSFGTWVHRIAVNRAVDHLRREQRSVLEVTEVVDDDPNVDPERLVTARISLQELRQHVEDLPEHLRVPWVLRELEELPYEEITAILQIPAATARVRVYRARAQLASAWREDAP